jgi:AcrR family transcriptional regulator
MLVKAPVGRGADPETTRRRILRAATSMYDRFGPDAVTVRAVSARARVTAPAIYWHFGSMDGLLREVMNSAFRQLITALEKAPVSASPVTQLTTATRIYRDFGLDHPRAYHTMFMVKDPGRGVLRQKRETAGRRAFAHLESLVAECHASRGIAGPESLQAAIAVWSLVHGMVALQVAGRIGMDRKEFDHFFDDALAVMLRGLNLG